MLQPLCFIHSERDRGTLKQGTQTGHPNRTLKTGRSNTEPARCATLHFVQDGELRNPHKKPRGSPGRWNVGAFR